MSRYDQCYFQKLLNDAMLVFVFSPTKLMEEVKMNKIMVLSYLHIDWLYKENGGSINYEMYVLKISSEL